MFQLFLRLGVLLGFHQEDGRNELKGSIEKRATSAPISSRMTGPARRARFEERDPKEGEKNKQFDVSSALNVREAKRVRHHKDQDSEFEFCLRVCETFGLMDYLKSKGQNCSCK